MKQLDDGRIALWTDDRTLMFLTPAVGGAEKHFVNAFIDSRIDAPPHVKQRIGEAVDGCIQCHSLKINNNQGAPSLARMFNADIASTAFKGYSRALLTKAGSWSREALTAFLDNPQRAVPGAVMPDPNINEAEVLEGVVDVLEGLATVIELE